MIGKEVSKKYFDYNILNIIREVRSISIPEFDPKRIKSLQIDQYADIDGDRILIGEVIIHGDKLFGMNLGINMYDFWKNAGIEDIEDFMDYYFIYNEVSDNRIEELKVYHVEWFGGGITSEWIYPYNSLYYGIPKFFYSIQDKKNIDDWISQFISIDNPSGRNYQELNVYNAVNELGILKEDFIKMDKENLFTDKEIEAIYSGNRSLINISFVNSSSILVGDVIYSVNWLATHTNEDYKVQGISDEMVKELLTRIRNKPLNKQYEKIEFQLTD